MTVLGGVTVRTVKDIAAPAAPEVILSFRRFDGSNILGKASGLITGAPTTQWNPTLRRYTRQGSVSSSAVQERLQIWLEPRAIVDPRYKANGLVARLRDTLHAQIIGAPPWAPGCYGRASFGFRAAAGNVSSANTNQTPFIGFRLDLLGGTSAIPNWKTEFVNWDSSVRRSIDTGIGTDSLRDLVVELSGVDQKVRWYIDNKLIDTYAPAAGDVGGQNALPADWSVCTEVSMFAGGAGTPTLTLSYHAGVGPLVTCSYHDA